MSASKLRPFPYDEVCLECGNDDPDCPHCEPIPGSPHGGHRPVSFYFWRFVHNAVIHPLIAFPYAPRWAERAHDWTARRCPGAG